MQPNPAIFAPILLAALALFAVSCYRRFSLVALGKPEDRFHSLGTRIGDMLGLPKSLLVNFVVKHRKKMVPAWNLPGATSFKAALAAGGRHTLEEPPISHDDIAFLQYTGGTTGVSKGAMLTHGNMIANMMQVSAWAGSRFREGEEIIITPRRVVTFHASPRLKTEVSAVQAEPKEAEGLPKGK